MASTASRLLLPRRLRLVKLLRAHGLRHAERLREDELKFALDGLALALGDEDLGPAPSPRLRAPSSDLHRPPVGQASTQPASTQPELDERWDDPHADPRFFEPKPNLPEGARTFLRLVAVDSDRLLLTWDLDSQAQAKAQAGVKLRLHLLDDDDAAPSEHTIDLYPGRWYLDAPGERFTVLVDLVTEAGEVLASSNPAVVPPRHAAPDGPLVFATLPIDFDRTALADRDLLASGAGDLNDLNELGGVTIEHAGVAPGLADPVHRLPGQGLPGQRLPGSGEQPSRTRRRLKVSLDRPSSSTRLASRS